MVAILPLVSRRSRAPAHGSMGARVCPDSVAAKMPQAAITGRV